MYKYLEVTGHWQQFITQTHAHVDVPQSMRVLKLRSQCRPIPCTTNTKWSIRDCSPV